MSPPPPLGEGVSGSMCAQESLPTLTFMADETSADSVIDPATFERLARCLVKEFDVESVVLSAETAIEHLVPIEERKPWWYLMYGGSDDSFLKGPFLASALEDEFDFDFDDCELDQALKDAPGGGRTLASWAWAVQRELNNKTCVIRLANYCPSCKKKTHRRNGWSSLNDLTTPKCCHRCGHQFKS